MILYNRVERRHMLLWIVVETLFIFLALGGGASALSNDGGGSWAHSRQITINNPGAALSDYQVLVTLDSSNFQFSQAKAKGEDIRFTNVGGVELPYWIENWSLGDAKVWVKVASVPVEASSIRMLWGNADASSSSSGDATFEFFDDFEGTSLNTALWGADWDRICNCGSYSFTISESKLRLRGLTNGCCYSGNVFTKQNYLFNNRAIETKITHSGAISSTFFMVDRYIPNKNPYFESKWIRHTSGIDWIEGGYNDGSGDKWKSMV